MNKPVKNIIFDFGDIFINLDKEAPIRGIYSLDPNFDLDESTIAINQNYETGAISTPEFINHYRRKLPNADENTLIEVWNSIILDLPEARVEFLESLQRDHSYRLFLLSNTNELHMQQVVQNTGTDLFDRFRRVFEKFYLSHEIGYRKPNQDIYTFVLHENQLKPGESLFIDDLPENTAAAAELGIHTWNLRPGTEDIRDLFDKNLPL